MVGTIPKKLPAFLARVHEMNRASGAEDLARAAGITPRSTQRWHRLFRDLLYFPNTECEALGLVHLHVFLQQPRGRWEEWPYGIRAEWLVQQPGDRCLYLHCLIPRDHEGDVRALLEELRAEGWSAGIEAFATRDSWQVFEHSKATIAWRQTSKTAWDLVERYPLVLPVIFEMTEQRRSIPEVWQAIMQRLGESVWAYLPDGVHPLPHNGKCYVTEALRLLNESFLVRQHIVRFRHDHTIDVLARIPLPLADILRLAGRDAPSVEIFPVTDAEHFARMSSTVALLRRLLTSECAARECWFVDQEAQRPCVRFAYELLFDPATTEWHFPRDEIKRRITR